MKDGPDISRIATLIADPGRANMLAALMSGKALTAGELAGEAGIQGQTASGHLTRLEEGGLITRERQGRHHYFRLADGDVAEVLEALMGLAAKKGQLRTRTGPRDAELRQARVCYNHLAGEMGVALYDGLMARGVIAAQGDEVVLTAAGRAEMADLGIDLSTKSRSPECKSCLDWSARRMHLAGRLGRSILDHAFAQGWAKRPEGTRVVRFTGLGAPAFREAFKL
ncbi:ArsR family transcriptional regulator [Litoreibacter ponti]|uniref:ArsR family transcriptional regulator n=1 Tax=Litoreibacter ponti TaxID=1510457 RepID=A0A2T6BJH8_9RHOB|nr:helix-turn-helix transcriptional regulator [Litoreibacter ponti]PTX56192.1 ArsR family transcriptional regulator [Litoreibacter ponti]